LFARRQARFVRLTLPGKPGEIEDVLGQAGEFLEPHMLVDLAELPNGREKRLRRLGIPATASVVRVCDKKHHADGDVNGPGAGRNEVGARILWTPESPLRIPILPGTVELDAYGIGTANAVNRASGAIQPVVSVPVTSAEQRAYNQMLAASALSVLPSDRTENHIYALPHPTEDGGTLEQIYPVASAARAEL